MSKHILVIGAGRSATVLIEYLVKILPQNQWQLTVADQNPQLAEMKTGKAPGTSAVQLDIKNHHERRLLISNADVVISMLPATMHGQIAQDCCTYRKHLLTASYISEEIRHMEGRIREQEILFLCEMGLDPGIDHMSAMEIINRLRSSGATIHAFTSHCGGLVAPECDDNPWHYKISWNPSNIVKAGTAGAIYKEHDQQKVTGYENLFTNCKAVNIPGYGDYAYYPNRDSLHYIPIYGLEQTENFLRTTLRHPDFCTGWNCIVKAGLTSDTPLPPKQSLTFKQWSSAILPFATSVTKHQFAYLGFFDELPIPEHLRTSAEVLQYLLEKKLMLKENDRDMIIMLHEFRYSINSENHELRSLLVVKGEDQLHTAMAKAVGLPLGIAAKLLLQDKIKLRGLQLPVRKEIYEPVLEELKEMGISFSEYEKKTG